jgi:hypothetical protein
VGGIASGGEERDHRRKEGGHSRRRLLGLVALRVRVVLGREEERKKGEGKRQAADTE